MKRALFSAALGLLFTLGGPPGDVLADELPTFNVVMKDGRIQPETLEVPANTRFRVVVRNDGPGAAEFESVELKKELVLAPGVTRSLVFFPLKPGAYRFFDDFHPATGQARIVAR